MLGHQGVYGELPANPLSGFRKAIEMGLDGIETDLHGTKDGLIVLMHDDDVATTMLGEGCLTQMTYEEARRLNVADKFRPGYPAEPVPSPDELLELAKPVPGFLLNLNGRITRSGSEILHTGRSTKRSGWWKRRAWRNG